MNKTLSFWQKNKLFRHFNAFYRHSSVAYLLMDAESNILQGNQASCDLLKIDAAKLIDQSLLHILLLGRNDLTAGNQMLTRLRQSAVMLDPNMEAQTENTIKITIMPIKVAIAIKPSRHKEVLFIVMLEKAQEQKIQKEENEFRKICLQEAFHKHPLPLFLTGGDLTILESNLAMSHLCAYSKTELKGIKFIDLTDPAFRSQFSHDLSSILQHEPNVFDSKIIGKKNNSLHVIVAGAKLSLAGHEGNLLFALWNKTKEKREAMEMQLRSDRLERFHKLTMSREVSILKLKEEVNSLLKKIGKPQKYHAPDIIKWNKSMKDFQSIVD